MKAGEKTGEKKRGSGSQGGSTGGGREEWGRGSHGWWLGVERGKTARGKGRMAGLVVEVGEEQ